MKLSETNGIDIYEYDKSAGKSFQPLVQFGDMAVIGPPLPVPD